MVLSAELLVTGSIIVVHSKDDRAFRRHTRKVVTEASGFIRTSRCVVLRIEIQYDLLPSKVLRRDQSSVVRHQREVGRRFTNREHRGPRLMQASVRHNLTDSSATVVPPGRCRTSCNIVSSLVFLVASFM